MPNKDITKSELSWLGKYDRNGNREAEDKERPWQYH